METEVEYSDEQLQDMLDKDTENFLKEINDDHRAHYLGLCVETETTDEFDQDDSDEKFQEILTKIDKVMYIGE